MNADWVSVAEALRIVRGGVRPLAEESCSLLEARDRVLARGLVSPIDLPLWTNSAMDGFALRSSDIRGASREAPVILRVVEDVPAGSFPTRPIDNGTATRVMTGAPVPVGADSVVRVEHTDGGKDIGAPQGAVRIYSDQDAAKNLRVRGEELTKGNVALPARSIMTPGAIGLAASLGYARVRVHRRPEVALLTSGEELVEVTDFDQVLSGRKIVSSNSYSLQAALEETGCLVRYLGIASDSEQSLRAALSGAEGCDALITSAGISVGEHDHVKRVLKEMEARVAFWRVRMRPGSPFAFGHVGGLGGIPWFGLPGNPVSSAVTFELFARPALLRMSGRQDIYRRALPARLLDRYDAPRGLTHFARVRLERDGEGRLCARLAGAQGSGMLSSVVAADGLMVIPEEHAGAEPGEILLVVPFDSTLYASTPGF